MNKLNNLVRACSEHPGSVGQSYWQHFRFSSCMSIRLLKAAFTALVHALIPGMFQSTTSRAITDMYSRVQEQTHRSGSD